MIRRFLALFTRRRDGALRAQALRDRALATVAAARAARDRLGPIQGQRDGSG